MSIRDGLKLHEEYGYPTYHEGIQLYRVGERETWLRAEIQVEVHQYRNDPPLHECRFAALQLHTKDKGYVVYDRLLSRIVDGVYSGDEEGLRSALAVAQLFNEGHLGRKDSCGGSGLGLIYPSRENLPDWDGTWQAKEGKEELI
jgi:hypothetical protein